MIQFQKNISLARFSNYHIGGSARYFFEAKNIREVKEAVQEIRERKLNFFILGGGTNLLISDRGFDGVVLKLNVDFLEAKRNQIFVGAGVLMENLLNFASRKGLSGLEWAGGLPGTVGGAIRGNAGAFGGETKDVIKSVLSFHTKTQRELERNRSACRFAYRTSIFKEKNGEEVILAATLKLKKGDRREVKQAIKEKIDYRWSRHPMEYPNIGSIFKNIPVAQIPPKVFLCFQGVVKKDPFPVVPTAFVISEAGLKGVRRGDALVSPKHPNFIVNIGRAKAKDVHYLINVIKKTVYKKFRILLEEEIQRLP